MPTKIVEPIVTCRVTTDLRVNPGFHGLEIKISPVYISPQTLKERSDAIAFASVREVVLSACRNRSEFLKYNSILSQIAAEEAKIAKADEELRDAGTSKATLEKTRTSSNLAEELKALTDRIEQAKKVKEQAEEALATLRPFVPEEWATASHAVRTEASCNTYPKLRDLDKQKQDAIQKTDKACSEVVAILKAAILQHLTPLLQELAVIRTAQHQSIHGQQEFIEEVVSEVMGNPPVGIRSPGGPTGQPQRFWSGR
jgi:hypothetical protein